MNGIRRAALLTLHAADAAVFAFLADNRAFFVVGAGNNGFYFIGRDEGDELVGAGFYAHTAGDAASGVDMGNAVFNADGVVLTDLGAVAAAEAACGAGAFSAIEHLCGGAGFKTVVDLLFAVVIAVAVAVNESGHGLGFGNLNAQNLRNALCDGGSAGTAEICGNGGILRNGLCVGVAAGIAAGAAVCAGKTITNRSFLFVYLHAHKGGGYGNENGSDKTYSRNEQDGIDNSLCHFTTSLRKQLFDNAAEAVEGNGNDGSGNEGYRNTGEALGRKRLLNLASHSGEEHHCKKEAESAAEGAYHGFKEAVAVLDVVDGNSKHRAVGGDKGKIHAEGFIKSGDVSFEHDFNELNQCGDNKDEHYGLEIAETVGVEQIGLNGPCCGGGNEHYEDNRKTHAGRLVNLFGNAEEGADSQKLVENVVVDQNGGQKDYKQRFKHWYSPPLLHRRKLFRRRRRWGSPRRRSSFLPGLCRW